MTLDELLTALREVDSRLADPEVVARFKKLSKKTRDQYVRDRGELGDLITELENAQLEMIAAKLKELSPQLEAGIKDLKSNLQALNDAIAVLDAIGTVLGLAARIIALLP